MGGEQKGDAAGRVEGLGGFHQGQVREAIVSVLVRRCSATPHRVVGRPLIATWVST